MPPHHPSQSTSSCFGAGSHFVPLCESTLYTLHNTPPDIITQDLGLLSDRSGACTSDFLHIQGDFSDTVSSSSSPCPNFAQVGTRTISCCESKHYGESGHSLLLTYSGEVYGWGDNDYGQVLYNGSSSINFPIKLPLTNIVSISAGRNHSLALSSEGKLYGWGSNNHHQINNSTSRLLSITLINIPYNIKEVFGGDNCSFALTQEGQVVKLSRVLSFESNSSFHPNQQISLITPDDLIVASLFLDGASFVCIDDNINYYFSNSNTILRKLTITKYLIPSTSFEKSVLLRNGFAFIIDVNGNVVKFCVVEGVKLSEKFKDCTFNGCDSIQIPGLFNIVSISGFNGVFAAIDNGGKVFVWGKLSRLSDAYEANYYYEPFCVEAFTNIEGVSVGHDFLFACNKSTVWAWGRNRKGQLGTGDLIDRPQPVKVFGSEILGSFQYPKQPLDRMFSGLIKLIYFEYLQYLKNLFGNHAYTKARFYTKCSISKKVAKSAKEVLSCFKFLKDPHDLNSNENICDLQLRLSTDYNGPKVINTRIKQLDVYYDGVDYDPQLLSFFPNVEVVKLGGTSSSSRRISVNLAHSSIIKYLELDYGIYVQQLPTSLVKLVFKAKALNVTDLSYLTSLKELVLLCFPISLRFFRGQIPLPQSIVRLEALSPDNVEIQLPNLKELVIHSSVPTNITEQNFPFLKFIQLIKPDKQSLANSELFPTNLIDEGLIESAKQIDNDYLVELSCFPWTIQYSGDDCSTQGVRDFVDLNGDFCC
ncbi:hypothetical protein P9112_010452 [Eukaryota sp. TZLM1-RC]